MSDHTIISVEGKFSKTKNGIQEVVCIVGGTGRGAGANPFKIQILDDLVELEKKWKLI